MVSGNEALIIILTGERTGARLRQHITKKIQQREAAIQKDATLYGRLCHEMEGLLKSGSAPPGVVIPKHLPLGKPYEVLGLDDSIWNDAGLDDADYDDDPAWLVDDNVQSGIRNMLELERCDEEDFKISHERSSMQEWMREEWRRVQRAKSGASAFMYCAETDRP